MNAKPAQPLRKTAIFTPSALLVCYLLTLNAIIIEAHFLNG
jgi:hypothetical protein